DLAVEVRSDEDRGPAAERSMAAKRDDYFAAGSQAVWDVDVQARTARPRVPREQGVITVRAFSRAICGAVAIAAAVACAAIVLSGQAAPGIESRVDAIFAKWTGTTPGCAVGVAANGKPSQLRRQIGRAHV